MNQQLKILHQTSYLKTVNIMQLAGLRANFLKLVPLYGVAFLLSVIIVSFQFFIKSIS